MILLLIPAVMALSLCLLQPGRQAAVDAGNTIIDLTPEQIEAWRSAADGIEAAWIEEMSATGMDAAARVQEARDLIAAAAGN